MIDPSQLSDLEHVRMRPTMYVGGTNARGLRQCVFEFVYYANRRGATQIAVTLNADDSVTVTDNGSGRDADTLERSMTDLGFEKTDDDMYLAGGGLHWWGSVVAVFLAARCDVKASTRGKTCQQSYRRGVAVAPVQTTGEARADGMEVTFLPDREIFQTTQFEFSPIRDRLQELSFLRPRIRYSIFDQRTGDSEEFHSQHGASDYVRLLNQEAASIHPVIAIKGEAEGVAYDIAFQYSETSNVKMEFYGNEVRCHELGGGHHVPVFKQSLVRLLKQAAENQGIPLDSIDDSDLFKGLTSMVIVRLKRPQWQGATKTMLMNAELPGVIETALNDFLPNYFENNPLVAKSILRQILDATW